MNIFRSLPTHQRGAALVVGMLLLLVLTLLAISGMNTASLELMMAGNTQYQQNAFQAAETGIEQALITGEFNPNDPVAEIAAANVLVPDTTNDHYTATIRRQLDGLAQSALWGASWDSFGTIHFEIQSDGSSARNAVASNIQGVAVIVPKSDEIAPLPGVNTLTP